MGNRLAPQAELQGREGLYHAYEMPYQRARTQSHRLQRQRSALTRELQSDYESSFEPQPQQPQPPQPRQPPPQPQWQPQQQPQQQPVQSQQRLDQLQASSAQRSQRRARQMRRLAQMGYKFR